MTNAACGGYVIYASIALGYTEEQARALLAEVENQFQRGDELAERCYYNGVHNTFYEEAR